MHKPLSFAHNVLDLFEGPLREVRFPDVDRVTLAAAAEEARLAEAAVNAAEEALAQARTARDDKQRAFALHAERAFAYARVFGEDQPELRAALEELGPRAPVKRTTRTTREETSEVHEPLAPPRRGRPRRLPPSDPLFEGPTTDVRADGQAAE